MWHETLLPLVHDGSSWAWEVAGEGHDAATSGAPDRFGDEAWRLRPGDLVVVDEANNLLRVDRKGRPAESIEHPALTLGLALQPEVLRDIARIPGFRGLLARILYSLPENTIGRRRIGTPAVPTQVMTAYDRHLQNLVLTLAATTEPTVMPLSPDANNRVLHLERSLEPRLAPEAELGHITDWASKLVGATTRIAGLLHLATGARTSDISATAVDAAARVGHYYLAHALAVFDTMAADPLLDDAAAVLDWIIRTEQTQFTRRAAFTGLSRARFRKVADLEPALEYLLDHGYIRPGPMPAPVRGRPPSTVFEVHPRAAKTAKAAELPTN